MLHTVLLTTLVCFLVMTITYFIARTINNYSIVDAVWGLNFPIIAAVIWFTAPIQSNKLAIFLIAVCIWGLRLGIHLGTRILGHLDREDGRYIQLREDWKNNLNFMFFGFFMMQAASNVFLAIPFFLFLNIASPEFSIPELAAIILWGMGILGESIADKQLSNFKKKAENKGKLCNVGLWNYSRHPNYFFEFTIWVSYALMCTQAEWGWLAWISPLSILYLLFKVTGIPLTEEQAVKSKGDAYKDYQRTTSVFVPWFRKK